MLDKVKLLNSNLSMLSVPLPLRACIVQLKQANVLLSPCSTFTPDDYSSEWSITDIVAGNLFHTEGIKNAHTAYPQATVWGSQRALDSKKNIAWNKVLTNKQWPFNDELTLIPIGGMPKFDEHVFIHHQSKSLIVNDLCFNLVDAKGLLSKLIFGFFGTYRKFAVSKLFLSMIQDKDTFQQSINQLFKHDFENIIMSHGHTIIEGNGKNQLKNAFAQHNIIV